MTLADGSQMNNRADQLQFLRFCAFLLVFNWHADWYAPRFFPGAYGAACAVEFFFLLSGFVSGYSSYGKDVSFSWKGMGTYLVKKLKKVYPLYFTVTMFTVAMTELPRFIAEHKSAETWGVGKILLRHLLLLQSWFPTDYFDFSGVGWFLSTIFFLYILNLPLRALATRIRSHQRSMVIFGVITCVSIAVTVLYCYALRDTYMEFTEYVLPVAHIGEYVGGMSLGYLICGVKGRIGNGGTSVRENDGSGKNARVMIMMSVLEVLSLAFWVWMMYTPISPWTARIVHWLAPNLVLVIVFGLGLGVVSSLFRCRGLVFLGGISFECFLIHKTVLEIYWKFTGIETTGIRGNTFSWMFGLVMTVLIAALVAGKPLQNKKS